MNEQTPQLSAALSMAGGARRTAALARWFQSLYGRAEPPILVGGAAVEVYTGGAYTTGDLDFVGEVPAEVARQLEAAGFRRRGRHWLHEEGEVFIELPAAELDPGARTERLSTPSGPVVLVAPEDLIADRLTAWEHWAVDLEGLNVYFLLDRLGSLLDVDRLQRRAAAQDVSAALVDLQDWLAREGPRVPRPEELAALRRRRSGG